MDPCARCSPPRHPRAPTGDEWAHEVKWDGVRVLADVTGGRASRLLSRNENDVTVAWPELRQPRSAAATSWSTAR